MPIAKTLALADFQLKLQTQSVIMADGFMFFSFGFSLCLVGWSYRSFRLGSSPLWLMIFCVGPSIIAFRLRGTYFGLKGNAFRLSIFGVGLSIFDVGLSIL